MVSKESSSMLIKCYFTSVVRNDSVPYIFVIRIAEEVKKFSLEASVLKAEFEGEQNSL